MCNWPAIDCILPNYIFGKNGVNCHDAVHHVLSLQNWYKEIDKWLAGRVGVLPIDTGSKEEIDRKLAGFLAQQGRHVPQAILVISYETLRMHSEVMHSRQVGLVICDEVSALGTALYNKTALLW